jgi:nucleoside-diphosphate-sugar epimerase
MPDEAQLEIDLSEPTAAVVEAMRRLSGDLLILGVAGKMGPSLARLALRASRAAGIGRQVIGVARFSDGAVRESLERDGIRTLEADLLDPAALARLPEVPNVVYMVGQKFGTSSDAARTWAVNAHLPGLVAERYARSRIVAFSTGNVYPFSDVTTDGPDESSALGPVGEYAQSAVARERILEFYSRRHGTPMAILRLNYAIEPRYGVLRDLADTVWQGRSVDVAMGFVNVIWQRDANAIALRAFAHCDTPPLVLNLTGRPAQSVRWLAEQFGVRFGKSPLMLGVESRQALLSNAAKCESLFGPPPVGIDEMIDRVAEWVEQGGRSLARPTHFEERGGKF